jgi:hypothetical protein
VTETSLIYGGSARFFKGCRTNLSGKIDHAM